MLFLVGGKEMAVYANTGEIKITLEDLQTTDSSRKDVEIWLYRVGNVSEEGIPTLYKSYGLSEYPKDNASLEAAAKNLAGMVSGDPLISGKTDEDGIAHFWGIEKGVYLVVIPENNSYGVVTPFMVPLPYLAKAEGGVELQYVVEAEPKASPHVPEQPDKPEKDKPDKPQGDGDKTPPQNQQPNTSLSLKTGDTSAVEIYLIAAVAAIACIINFIIYRRKHS